MTQHDNLIYYVVTTRAGLVLDFFLEFRYRMTSARRFSIYVVALCSFAYFKT